MSLFVVWSALSVPSGAHGAPVEMPTPQTFPVLEGVRLSFERFAKQMPYLDPAAVAYDRDDHFFEVADPNLEKLHFAILREIAAPRFPTESLLGLLAHDDPKVRTLAIAALTQRCDPQTLPHVVRLGNDEAPTFDAHPELHAAWLRHSGIGPPERSQKVGLFARQMVAQYCPPAQFTRYWNERKQRTFCAGWFGVQLTRAGQGMSPIDESRSALFAEIRKQIDQLPAEDAAWTLLYLRDLSWAGESSERVSDDADLLRRCRAMGREKLLLALQRKTPSTDPDVRAKGVGAVRWVLSHAKELFLPTDTAILLECARREREVVGLDGQWGAYSGPFWYLTAAELQPERAGEFVHAALEHQTNRNYQYSLMMALWKQCGAAEAEFVLNWFLDTPGDRGTHPQPQEAFLDACADDDRPAFRTLIARIIADPRLESLGPRSLVKLSAVVADWTDAPVYDSIDAQALADGHSFHYFKEWISANPEGAQRAVAARAATNARLRASVPTWQPKATAPEASGVATTSVDINAATVGLGYTVAACSAAALLALLWLRQHWVAISFVAN